MTFSKILALFVRSRLHLILSLVLTTTHSLLPVISVPRTLKHIVNVTHPTGTTEMHQHKISAQILLTLSIFNLVLGAVPVVRINCDTRDDLVVPVVVRNTEVMFKERGSESDGPSQPSTPPSHDGPTPLHSSAPPSPDWPSPSHSSLSLSDEKTPLLTLPPTGPEIVPASDSDSPPHSPKPSSHDYWYWESHDELPAEPLVQEDSDPSQAHLKKIAIVRNLAIASGVILIGYGLLKQYNDIKHQSPDD